MTCERVNTDAVHDDEEVRPCTPPTTEVHSTPMPVIHSTTPVAQKRPLEVKMFDAIPLGDPEEGERVRALSGRSDKSGKESSKTSVYFIPSKEELLAQKKLLKSVPC